MKCHSIRGNWSPIMICGAWTLFASSVLFAQTIRVDTSHPVKSIIPTEALGAGIGAVI